jgi:hypothetical protein
MLNFTIEALYNTDVTMYVSLVFLYGRTPPDTFKHGLKICITIYATVSRPRSRGKTNGRKELLE